MVETTYPVTKAKFLQLYAKAHEKAFAKENILQAFKKTGLHPLNPNAITMTQTALALEHLIHELQ
jgi:hypothetical protein